MRASGITTYSSGLAMARPSGPRATWGDPVSALTASRSRPLDISESAPFRSTSTFCSDPVRVSATANPLASASIPMNTATTSPMPSAVSAVDTGRWRTLRRL